MTVKAVYGKADELRICLFEFFCHCGKGHELRCTYRCEVCRVAEKDYPASLIVIGEIDLTLCGYCPELRSLVANTWHRINFFFHN